MSLRRIEIEECHQHLLEIAKCFDQLCATHQIPYYMLGGTMLGAIRHRGFIPWDDDMDFGIPRPFFDQFIKVAEKELPKQYSLLTRQNSPAIPKGFIKIQLKGSKLIEKVFNAQKPDFYNGIAIDVFPLDGCNSTSWLDRLRIKYIFTLIRIHEGRFCSLDIRKGMKKLVAAIIQTLPLNDKKLANRIDQLIQSWNYEKSPMLSNCYGHWKEREIIHKLIFGEPKPYAFGPLFLYGVSDADGYLKQLYGDYMLLPPKEQQLTHADEIYITDEKK